MPVNHHKSRKQIFIDNLLGGIGWGIGATVGVSLLILVLSAILNFLNGLPLIGHFFASIIEVTDQALKNRPN